MSLYAGIDLHSTNSVLAVIDEHDRVLRQCRLPNELPTILKAVEPYRDELVGVAVESTYNWYWLVDGLVEHGYPMRLVNTAAVPQYDGLKYSGDESDARHLAHLMCLGILPEGYIENLCSAHADTWTDTVATDECYTATIPGGRPPGQLRCSVFAPAKTRGSTSSGAQQRHDPER